MSRAASIMKVLTILVVGVTLALGLYILVQTEFSMNISMGPGGISFGPGFSWLLSVRAAENGGQIAPPLDELGASAGAMPFGGVSPFGGSGAVAGTEPVPLDKGFDPGKAGATLLRDLGLLAIAVIVAVLAEMAVTAVGRLLRRVPAHG